MSPVARKVKQIDEKGIVRKWLPILLKTDPAFREEVMVHFTGVLATKDDIAKILAVLAEHSKRIEEHSKRIEEHSKKIEEHSKKIEEHSKKIEEHSKRIEELSKRIEEHSKILQEHSKRIEKFDKTLSAVGARWGILAEDAFREGIRGILKDFGFEVKKWRIRDEDGVVYGKVSMIEADLLIRDGIHILLEIKSSVSRFDVAGFKRVAELYEREVGESPRLVIVSPFIDGRATALAEEMGIDCYSTPEEMV